MNFYWSTTIVRSIKQKPLDLFVARVTKLLTILSFSQFFCGSRR